MNTKYSDSKMYWKIIKLMAKTYNVVHVEPDKFQNYFELLFTLVMIAHQIFQDTFVKLMC